MNPHNMSHEPHSISAIVSLTHKNVSIFDVAFMFFSHQVPHKNPTKVTGFHWFVKKRGSTTVPKIHDEGWIYAMKWGLTDSLDAWEAKIQWFFRLKKNWLFGSGCKYPRGVCKAPAFSTTFFIEYVLLTFFVQPPEKKKQAKNHRSNIGLPWKFPAHWF